MIQISTDSAGTRLFKLPRELVAVAVELFGREPGTAVYQLMSAVSANQAATAIQVAMYGGHLAAVEYVRNSLKKSALTGRL
jgi:hypothetical protein